MLLKPQKILNVFRTPRPHEYGGTYGEGVIVRKYAVGGVINIRVELTASHFGYFEFAICPDYKTTTQECLDKNILKLIKPQEGVDHNKSKYFPKDGNKVYEMKYRLPKRRCDHCVLQWRYRAGNNWGNCPNGTGAVGCGPQEEFRACADITITGKAEPMLPDIPTTSTVSTVVTTTPTHDELPPVHEESYSPISALIVTLLSFLVVCLILFLLYFHFYQIGKQLKSWLKESPKKHNASNQKTTLPPLPPLPPPRIRKPGVTAFGGRKTLTENV
ncbi:hypothetical protein WA026_002796 [Henosepilachna vigintioctopunctata]|uniref:Chitin-binding type-4 domain-containing protein n=1 Tax=Henosepilachna vigintioctopunctata TaxID=420089 RepID=A0AAW1U0Q2_9CUCU